MDQTEKSGRNREKRAHMRGPECQANLEVLARIAARAAGRDPDERVQVVLGDTVAFDDAVWRYDDFMLRAEAAYEVLTGQTVDAAWISRHKSATVTQHYLSGSVSNGSDAGEYRSASEDGGSVSRLRS
jgi:hypothetical protein